MAAANLGSGINQWGQRLAWGVTDAQFQAIAANAGIYPHKVEIRAAPEFVEERANTLGVTSSMTVGPWKKTATVTGSVISVSALFSSGNSFIYDGELYIVTAIQRVEDHKTYVEATITAEQRAGITA